MWKTNYISISLYQRDFLNFVTMYKVVQGGYSIFNATKTYKHLKHNLFQLNQNIKSLKK